MYLFVFIVVVSILDGYMDVKMVVDKIMYFL